MPDDFDEAMLNIYRTADKQLGIKFRNFLDKVVTLGGIGAARHFLNDPLQSGFVSLWEHRRLDLTMEALVLQPKWSGLFTAAELGEAKKRLDDHGWKGQKLGPAP